MVGFDAAMAAGAGEKKVRVTKRKKLMFDSVVEWLFREVYV